MGPYESSTNFESTVFLDGWECWMMTLISSDAGNWNKTQNTFVWPVRAGQLDETQTPPTRPMSGVPGRQTAMTLMPISSRALAQGRDGEYRAGVAWPSPRFTDNGNGTVTDNLTGVNMAEGCRLSWRADMGKCPELCQHLKQRRMRALRWLSRGRLTPPKYDRIL